MLYLSQIHKIWSSQQNTLEPLTNLAGHSQNGLNFTVACWGYLEPRSEAVIHISCLLFIMRGENLVQSQFLDKKDIQLCSITKSHRASLGPGNASSSFPLHTSKWLKRMFDCLITEGFSYKVFSKGPLFGGSCCFFRARCQATKIFCIPTH